MTFIQKYALLCTVAKGGWYMSTEGGDESQWAIQQRELR